MDRDKSLFYDSDYAKIALNYNMYYGEPTKDVGLILIKLYPFFFLLDNL